MSHTVESAKPPYLGWFLLLVLIIANLLIGYVTPWLAFAPSSSDDTASLIGAGLLIGACICQLNLISVWCALAPGRIVIRIPWALGLLTLMWYALALGNRFPLNNRANRFDTSDAIQLGFVLLASFLVAVVPIYLAAGLWKWRLETPKSAARRRASSEEQFSVGLMLAGMGFASVLLALGRVVLPPGTATMRGLDNELLYILPILAACNLVITVPSLWVSFATWSMTPIYFAGCLGHCLVVTGVEIILLSAFLGSPPPDAMIALTALNCAQFLWVFATMLVLRLGLGFDLVRINRVVATSPFAESPFAESPAADQPRKA